MCDAGDVSRRETRGTRPPVSHRDRVSFLAHTPGRVPSAGPSSWAWRSLARAGSSAPADTKKSTSTIFFLMHAVRAGHPGPPKKIAARGRANILVGWSKSARARICAPKAAGAPKRVLLERSGEAASDQKKAIE